LKYEGSGYLQKTYHSWTKSNKLQALFFKAKYKPKVRQRRQSFGSAVHIVLAMENTTNP